jgi:hypothetical protein
MADVEERVISNLQEQMQALKKENYMLALKSMPILVTGCSGYIASLLTKMLCEAGYNVRGTVRSKADATKVFDCVCMLEAGPHILGNYKPHRWPTSKVCVQTTLSNFSKLI